MNKSQNARIRSVRGYLLHLKACEAHAQTGEDPWGLHAAFERMEDVIDALEGGSMQGSDATLEAWYRIQQCPPPSLERLGWVEVEGLALEM